MIEKEAPEQPSAQAFWQKRLHEVIYESDTPIGKAFDVILILCILFSVFAVILESVPSIHEKYSGTLVTIELVFTILFTIEYLLRLSCVESPGAYAKSFFGIVDLLAILPAYLGLFVPGLQTFLIIRILRLLRLFRIFKMTRYVSETHVLIKALKASKNKITVFLLVVLVISIIIGTIMYLVEGNANGFESIPDSIYWAITTMSTVGYGDVVPKTLLGKFFASVLMLLGYGILAVPTGIVSVELARADKLVVSAQACLKCGRQGHDSDAKHCKFCGGKI